MQAQMKKAKEKKNQFAYVLQATNASTCFHLLQATNVLPLASGNKCTSEGSDSEAQMKHVMPLIPKMEQI
jgi:hypothetical protein